MLKSCLFILGYAFSIVFATFTITEPAALKEWWTLNSDANHYSIANFGDIPWGSQIEGQIGLASPLDACTGIQINNIASGSPSPPIVLATRGMCPFTTKARNAEVAGIKLLLIVDNSYEDVESTMMTNTIDNSEPIHIATVMISKQGGDKLIETVEQSQSKNTLVSGIFNFAVSKQESVTYHLWLSNAQRESFEFLKDFKQYRDKLSPLTTPEIHFATTRANEASTANCICRDNRYCSPWAEGSLFKSGAEVILEDLRQLCIIKQFDLDTWWKYVLEFANSCLNSQNTADCSKSVIQKLDIDSSDIEFCMRGSFDQNDYQSCSENSLLEKESLAQSSDQPTTFLGIKINNFFYRGNLVPSKGVFSAICQSFQNMPEVCRNSNTGLSQAKPVFPLGSDSSLLINFNISEPLELKTWWTQNLPSIQYSLADFGNIPWGKEISSSIYLTNPLDACSSIKPVNDSSTTSYIMVSVRGGCEFSVKARNADAIGAKMLLIVDDQHEDVRLVTITDTNEENQPRIKTPTVLISREGGEKLIEILRGQRNQKSSVAGTFEFRAVKNEIVKYQLWLSSWDTSSFQFLKDFKRYHEKLSPFAAAEFLFPIVRSDSLTNPECICGGKYCSKTPIGSRYNSGPAMILENLRQLCIIKDYDMLTWWDYIINFNESVLKDENITEYSNNILSKIDVDTTDIDWCVRGSFDQYNYRTCKRNILLESQNIVTADFPLPSVKINDFFYRGNLVPARGVFEAICHSFVEEPEICRTYHEDPEALPKPKEPNTNLPSSTPTSSSSSPESPIEATVNEASNPKQVTNIEILIWVVKIIIGVVLVSLAFYLYVYIQKKGRRTQNFYQAQLNESEMMDTPKYKEVSKAEVQEHSSEVNTKLDMQEIVYKG